MDGYENNAIPIEPAFKNQSNFLKSVKNPLMSKIGARKLYKGARSNMSKMYATKLVNISSTNEPLLTEALVPNNISCKIFKELNAEPCSIIPCHIANIE